MWKKVEGFANKIEEWWQTHNFMGSPSFMLAKRLQPLKNDLKKWNKEVVGNVLARKDFALKLINHWDSVERLRPLSKEGKRSQKIAKDNHSHQAILEKTLRER